MSFQSLGFLAFLAVTLAVCLPAGRRSPRAGRGPAGHRLRRLLPPGPRRLDRGAGRACLPAAGHRRDGLGPPADGPGRRRPPPDAGPGLRLPHRRAGGLQVHGVPHRRRGGGGLGAPGPELLHLPAAVAAEGGLYRGIHPSDQGTRCCSTACFSPPSPPAPSCGRTPSSPSCGERASSARTGPTRRRASTPSAAAPSRRCCWRTPSAPW